MEQVSVILVSYLQMEIILRRQQQVILQVQFQKYHQRMVEALVRHLHHH